MFDYHSAARRTGIKNVHLDQICHQVRSEFPDDEMMFELHVLRAVLAIESGRVSLDHRSGLSYIQTDCVHFRLSERIESPILSIPKDIYASSDRRYHNDRSLRHCFLNGFRILLTC